MSKFGSLRDMMGRFRKDQSGNIMMLFGLSLVPLMGVVGVAVDYSRASNARQSLNAALDSAALMAARDAQKLTDVQLTARVNAWLKDNLPADVKSEFTSAQVSIDRTARTVKIVANAQVPTTIARVLGSDNLAVSSSSQSTWGLNTIELALVLDNTGSMAQSGKMTALKQASLDLIQIMKDSTQETDQIRISIVPFNTQVRISRSLKDEQWIRYGMTRNVNVSVTCDTKGQNCVFANTNTKIGSDVSNCVPTGQGKKNQTCTQLQTLTKATWANSEGCIADRDQNYDVTDGGATASNAQAYPATWCGQSSLVEAMGLTSDWTSLSSKINAMTPVGNTNVTIGAVWGWATLSTDVPFTEAKPAETPRLKKYMILLTDGDNTQNRFTTSQSAIDSRTALACTGIKNAGITVYTIRVMDGNATLLQNCASDQSKYYEVTSASQLSPIFKAIANEISQVRLTQ
ncbi:pilus assembly protein TadG-related protein [Bosea sp. RCC_152_1]|uniref:pilus assembly protein TadG-related protein n=1 Tax=Bosea sp. RCC_152_1 TaxID=3239228 RepID=UPI0035248AC4